MCNYLVTESPDGKEFIVDFLLGESKQDQMSIVEFNAYRFKQIELTDKKKGIIVYAYAKRSYNGDITKFMKSLGEKRGKYLKEMIAVQIPEISLQDN